MPVTPASTASTFRLPRVVRPLLDVERYRIVLGHVDLADAADLALPGNIGRRGNRRTGHGAGPQYHKLATVD